MSADVLFSDDAAPFSWSDIDELETVYGAKAAGLATLPRLWTLPFVLVPATPDPSDASNASHLVARGEPFLTRLRALAGEAAEVIVRSSVVGETIWDRGTYASVRVGARDAARFANDLRTAAQQVLNSAPGKRVGLVIQRFLTAKSSGEFGNLLRISKTRDHWELHTTGVDGATSKTRFNSQRDEAAASNARIAVRAGIPAERVFGSAAAWLNNELLRGVSDRVNLEWLTDNNSIYVVQIDKEDEDVHGVNPLQLRVEPAHSPASARGTFLAAPRSDELLKWDKLKVLDELWEPDEHHKPMLFFVRLSDLPATNDRLGVQALQGDFRDLIGPDNIVVRTSIAAGDEKILNLPRTESVSPIEAAEWCLKTREALSKKLPTTEMAFVAHRFISSRSSAWVKADPTEPIVEIHSLWGLPDALQFCPYDIWEVHVPTGTATDYPDYKSNILLPDSSGAWRYIRVKNELARSLSVKRAEAVDLARRTAAIARKLERPCHVMWFVGCRDSSHRSFSIPWYWTKAHQSQKNSDRSSYNIIRVTNHVSLQAFQAGALNGPRQAIELEPVMELMRDEPFIVAVGSAALSANVPVVLHGSTLAHAYYQLRRMGCTVLSTGEKDHSRVRQQHNFGKLVRDKIVTRIAQRQESEVSRKVPRAIKKGFLTGKLVEESIELRRAQTAKEKTAELADIYEVWRALCQAEDVRVSDALAVADDKRQKAGGFSQGTVLVQTGILSPGQTQDDDRAQTQVLATRVSADTCEIPFSFFGFMEVDRARTITFEEFGISLQVMLKGDRVQIRIINATEQLELPLDLSVATEDDGEEATKC